MPKWPDWKKLKETVDDPERRDELREKLQGGLERGRDETVKRLSGPAAHLRKVGSQFKAGLTEPDPPAAAPAPEEPPPAAQP